MEYILAHMVWFWLAVAALAIFVEASTPVLVSIWFAAGALSAMIAAALDAALVVQTALFVFVSIAAICLLRPLAKKFLDPHLVPTNLDRVVGMEGRVTEKIVNDYAQGSVSVDGKTWSARSENGDPIPAGELVEVLRIESVKLVVRSVPTAAAAKEH